MNSSSYCTSVVKKSRSIIILVADKRTRKMSTSYEQKNSEHGKKEDGASDNISGNSSSRIDAVSDILGRLDISNNDGDDKLFANPPPKEDCPICMVPMPFTTGLCGVHTTYMPCCGKLLCYGCIMAAVEEMKKGNMKQLCAFCRIPHPRSHKDMVKRIKKRIQVDDALAFLDLGLQYRDGGMGLPQDMNKAMELWSKAAELGSSGAHVCLATAYYKGEAVEKDTVKGVYHMKLAAIKGDETARHNLGIYAYNNGNFDLAIKHFIIGAKAGNGTSMKLVGEGYKKGLVTKEDYASTLRAHQVSVDEMKSEQRSKAMEYVN